MLNINNILAVQGTSSWGQFYNNTITFSSLENRINGHGDLGKKLLKRQKRPRQYY
jgi:hypothetical protein